MQAFAIAATALQVIGTITGGNEADKIGGRNATALNERADATLRASGTREGMLRERNQQTLAGQRAALSQNGIDPTSGTALIGAEQNMRDAELDALTLRYEGLLEARDLRTQADMAAYEGKAKKKSSRLSAVGSIIGAAGGYLSSSGWGTKGPGFSGQQAPAPVVDRSTYYRG